MGGEAPLENFSSPLEKSVGYSLKILGIVQKISAPLRKLFAPPGVLSWLRACLWVIFNIYFIQYFMHFAELTMSTYSAK